MKMSFFKKNGLGLFGAFSGLLFFSLLAVRMDLIHLSKTPSSPPLQSWDETRISDSDAWMNIVLNNQKIGYTHRHIENTANGYRVSEKTYLKMNIMGMVQDLFIDSSSQLNHNFSLSAFDFNLSSGTFDFSAKGQIQNRLITITVGKEKTSLPIKTPVYSYTGVLDALKAKGLFFDKPLEYNTFDPVSLANETVIIQFDKKEYIRIGNTFYDAAKLNIRYKGIVQNAWLDEAGNLLQETGPMGMRSEKTTKTKALEGFNVTRLQDLTESVSILPNRPIRHADKLSRLTLKIDGITDNFDLNGGRQQFKDPLLTIEKEALDKIPAMHASGENTNIDDFLKASPVIQSDHEKIKKIVSEITHPSDSQKIKAKKMLNWIFKNIEKRPVLSIPNAVDTLKNKKGDCNEHAVLFAAMARAADIPAQIEIGLVYMRGRFYYHAWNVVYLEGWITADASLNQIPADVTHIRLIRGEMTDPTDLVHVIGNLSINIPEPANDSVE